MWKFIFFSLMALVAHAGSSGFYAQKSFKAVAGISSVHVVVFADGHLIGNPYRVELRPDCQGRARSWKNLQLEVAKSFCAVDRDAIEVNRATGELFVRVREFDQEKFHAEVMKDPINAIPKCQTEWVSARFDLKKLCQPDVADDQFVEPFDQGQTKRN